MIDIIPPENQHDSNRLARNRRSFRAHIFIFAASALIFAAVSAIYYSDGRHFTAVALAVCAAAMASGAMLSAYRVWLSEVGEGSIWRFFREILRAIGRLW